MSIFSTVPDDESDDEAPSFGVPLPPDDRLWRHPSELGPVGGSTSVAGDEESRKRANMWSVAVVAGLVGAALSLGVVAMAGAFSGKVVERPVVEKVPVRTVSDLASAPSGVVGVTKSMAPALVRLQVDSSKGPVVGSGVIFRNDGYLVADSHLVQSAATVQAMLSDGRTLPGTVLGTDKWTGVAVIKIDAAQLPVAMLGSATDLQVGQTAIAIGAPGGTTGGPSVTVGVVSGLGKEIKSVDGVALHDMVATDAADASGSTGGALCDEDGVVVGLLTSVTQPDDTNLDFAAPIDVVKSAAEDIIATGTAKHTWLGVEGADDGGGARVTKVVVGSPAAQAGLANDDVIAAIDGTKVTSMSALRVSLRGHHAGDTITLVVMRSGQDMTVTATLIDKTPS